MNDGCLRLSPDSVVALGAAGWCLRPPQGRYAAAGCTDCVALLADACTCYWGEVHCFALLWEAWTATGLLHGLSHECWEACRCLWTVLEAWHCVRQPQVQQS